MINTQLLRKEIALQRTNLMFLAGIMLFWGILFVASFFAKTPTGFERLEVGEVVQMLNCLVIFPALIVLFPLMVGASAVATERRLGTLDWQLSQPRGRLAQWKTKSLAVLALAFLVGGVLVMILNRTLTNNVLFQYGIPKVDTDPLPGWLLRGLSPAFYAMFLAAAGLYTSTLTRDAYRALMGAIAMAVFTFYIARAVIDPEGMLWPSDPFHGESSYPLHGAFMNPAAHYLVLLALTLSLLYLGYRNFRFEHVSWRRLARQLIVWTIVANVTGWYLLKCEYNTPAHRYHFGGTIAVSQFLGWYGVLGSNPVRLNPDQLLAVYGNHIVRVDVPTGTVWQYPTIQTKRIDTVDPAGKGFTAGGWVLEDSHIPILTGSVLWRWLRQELPAWNVVGDGLPANKVAFTDQDGVRQVFPGSQKVQWSGSKLFVVDDETTDPKRSYLLRKGGVYPETCILVDSGYADIHRWCASPDEKWYTDRSVSGRPLAVMSVDGRTSYTLDPRGGVVCVASGRANSLPSPQTREMGESNHTLPVSPDGRYLPFIRTTPAQVIVNGSELCPGFPKSVEVALLDLKSGKETTITQLAPGKADVASQEVLLRQALSGNAPYGYSDMPRDRVNRLDNGRWIYTPSGLPMAWSKDGRLAILNDGALYVCERKNGSDDFSVVRVENLPDRGTNLEFWDNTTLLVWGGQGLWRVDLPVDAIPRVVAMPWTELKSVAVQKR